MARVFGVRSEDRGGGGEGGEPGGGEREKCSFTVSRFLIFSCEIPISYIFLIFSVRPVPSVRLSVRPSVRPLLSVPSRPDRWTAIATMQRMARPSFSDAGGDSKNLQGCMMQTQDSSPTTSGPFPLGGTPKKH